MAAIDWCEVLDWGTEQITELRVAGYEYLRQGHYQRALAYFEALVALNPTSAYDNLILGALYLQLDDPTHALERLDRALAIEPNNLSAQLNKAKALLISGVRKEGLVLAGQLTSCVDSQIKDLAEALVMAYS